MWRAQLGKQIITILVIYHPPIGNAGNTHTRFLDQVSELLQYSITNHKNLVVLGDFNIAIQDLGNLDSQTYKDTMEALGLTQHIGYAMHQLGNTLDHIYTESIDALEVRLSFLGEFLSDHRLVGIEINKRKITCQLENQNRRPFKDLDLDAFKQEFRNDVVIQHRQLDGIWLALEKELTRTLDKLIPEAKQRRKGKPHRPWYLKYTPIQVCFKGVNTLKSIMMHPKDRVSSDQKKDLVYHWECKADGCSSSYIGETSRALGERVKEHSNSTTSAILKHCKDFHHPLPSINDFNIIDKEPSQITLEAKEAIHIR